MFYKCHFGGTLFARTPNNIDFEQKFSPKWLEKQRQSVFFLSIQSKHLYSRTCRHLLKNTYTEDKVEKWIEQNKLFPFLFVSISN